MTSFENPTLAAKVKMEQLSSLNYPLFISPKLDGIRCVVRDGVAFSRTGKPIRNKEFQEWCYKNRLNLEGLDGELVWHEVSARFPRSDDFQKTTSTFMSFDKPLDDSWAFIVFDGQFKDLTFRERYELLEGEYLKEVRELLFPHLRVLSQTEMNTPNAVVKYYTVMLKRGFEGICLRSPDSPYKHGRSTLNQQYLLKLKPEASSEARIIDYVELCRNENEPMISETGHQVRSQSKENMVPANMLGAFIVCDGARTFHVGSGFTEDQRIDFWNNRELMLGRLITYTYQEIGSKDAPRFPIFKGFRED